jgi:hypothetical protein
MTFDVSTLGALEAWKSMATGCWARCGCWLPLYIDDDDVIAHIDVRGIEDIELAGEDGGGLSGEAAEGLAGGVKHKPLTLDIFAARNGGGHRRFYSLILPSSVFGVVHEECGARLMVRELQMPVKIDCSGQSRVTKKRKALFQRAGDEPPGLGYALNLWDGCFRAAVLKAAPSGSTTDAPDV